MVRFFLVVLVVIGLCQSPRALAEEKIVTTPLLTQLTSTTISGYVDTSAYWRPGAPNIEVVLPNGKITFVTSRDLLALRWAIRTRQVRFLGLFISAKERLSTVDANEFDAKYLRLLMSFSNMAPTPVRLIKVGAAPF